MPLRIVDGLRRRNERPAAEMSHGLEVFLVRSRRESGLRLLEGVLHPLPSLRKLLRTQSGDDDICGEGRIFREIDRCHVCQRIEELVDVQLTNVEPVLYAFQRLPALRKVHFGRRLQRRTHCASYIFWIPAPSFRMGVYEYGNGSIQFFEKLPYEHLYRTAALEPTLRRRLKNVMAAAPPPRRIAAAQESVASSLSRCLFYPP